MSSLQDAEKARKPDNRKARQSERRQHRVVCEAQETLKQLSLSKLTYNHENVPGSAAILAAVDESMQNRCQEHVSHLRSLVA